MYTDVQPSPNENTATLTATSLTEVTDREFYRHVGDINAEHAAAAAAFQAAQDNLVVMLTEQICRTVLAVSPDAAMVFVRAAAEYHTDENGTRNINCDGHQHRLVPFEVLDENGTVLGGFDPLSPVTYAMERLTPILGVEDQVLDIETRSWALDCTN